MYGKGTARDCRKHVQKLNMARGEVERGMFRDEGSGGVVGRGHRTQGECERDMLQDEGGGGVVVRGERERSTDRDRGEGKRRELRGSHPPCDYANTFTTQTASKETENVVCVRDKTDCTVDPL